MNEKIEIYDSKLDSIFSKSIVVVPILFFMGLALRIYFTAFDLPSRSSDAFFFLIHALSFPNALDYIGGTYFMWSGLLAVIFLPFQFENYEGYFTIIRITSISISSLSSVILFFIAKQIMSRKFALFSMVLFVFEPNIIENSIFGLTEPLFILLGLLSLYFLFQGNQKLVILSFVFAALAADTRATGLILLPVLMIGTYYRHKDKKEFFKYLVVGVGVFIILYMPMIVHEQVFPNSSLLDVTSEQSSFSSEQNEVLDNKFLNSAIIEITHFFRIALPYLIFFTPVGFFVAFYRITWKLKLLFLIIIFQFLIAIPQYTVSVEFRNLFFVVPIFCIFGALGIEYFTEHKKLKNILLVCLTFGIILSSFYFLNERQPDPELILEKEKFGKYVASNLDGVVATASDWAFIEHNVKLSTDSIQPENPFRPLEGEIKLLTPDFIIHDEKQLIEYIDKNNINYLIVDDEESKRFKMSQEIYFNENKFEYLEKVFDSDKNGYKKYRVKIFEINYNKLE